MDEPAPFLQRIVARVLDTWLQLMAIFVVSLAVGVVFSIEETANPVSFVVSAAGVTIVEATVLHRWGRTPAMALFGLRVVGRDGGPVSWGAAARRTAVLWVLLMAGPYAGGRFGPLLLAVALVALLGTAVLRSDRRGLHDLVGGTRVVGGARRVGR
jgi:uncharacterized RDD family membrane protein YckC